MKVSNFSQDPSVGFRDSLLGSSSDVSSKPTKSYSIESIFSLLNKAVGNNIFINTTNTNLYPIGTHGYFYVYNQNNQFTSVFSEAKKITFSIVDAYSFNVLQRIQSAVESREFLFKFINIYDNNNLVYLIPSEFVLNQSGTSFTLNVEVYLSTLNSGSFLKDNKYILVLEHNMFNSDSIINIENLPELP